MRTTPLILTLTLFLAACGSPTGTDCADCDDTDPVDTGCDTDCPTPDDPDGDGVTQDDGDCGPTDATVYPDAPELLDGIDNDCDATVDEGTVAYDDDSDSYTEEEGDCDDDQPAVNPVATDLVGDAIDQNCDGADGFDADGDGHASPVSGGDDCDDADPITFPGAIEVWYDGTDQTCSGVTWAGDSDQDGDLYPSAFVGGADCDDTNAGVNPAEVEDNENGVDDNCNGITDGAAFTMTWGSDPVLSVTLTDVGADRGVELMVIDTFDRYSLIGFGATAIPTTLAGTDQDGFPAWPFTGPEANMTFALLFGNEGCYAWGYDVSLVESANCLSEDPTAW